MRKADVTQSHHQGLRGQPMLCVKDRASYASLRQEVLAKFACPDDVAEQAIGFALDGAREQFWAQMKYAAREVFGTSARVYAAGRSGGWLVVDGLAPVASWNAVALGRWSRFRATVVAEMAWRRRQLLTDIEANRWAEEGAALFNFMDVAGGTVCLADVNRETALARTAIIERLAHA